MRALTQIEKDIRTTINKKRLEKGLTVTELVSLLNISRESFYQKMKANVDFKLGEIIDIYTILDMEFKLGSE